ncbi:MAG TPA: hypothetical protein VH722_04940 [Alphaproteobacteria bacterium]|jgi:hypothetical protein|nr:hypothetical protein [Alphaproteobacteria bacterium]
MKILGLNRVELLLDDRDLDKAIETFNTGLGFGLCPPLTLGEGIRSSVDFDKGLELVSPSDETSPVFPILRERGKGALLTIVWEVDSIEAAKRWAEEKGLPVLFTYEGHGIRQLCLHESAFFGYVVTLMERVAT